MGSVARPRRRMRLAFALLFALARPAAAQVQECANEPGFRVLCYTSRVFWNVAAHNAKTQGRYFVDFNQFTTNTSFETPIELDLGPFTLSVENGPFCAPGVCQSNYIQPIGFPPLDPTIDQLTPFVRAIINCKPDLAPMPPRECTAESIQVRLQLDPTLRVNAFGADFARANTSEGTDLQLTLSDGSSVFIPVAPELLPVAVDPTLAGFFGVLIDDLGNDLFLTDVRLVPRELVPDTPQGKVGEKLGMDNVGTIPDCLDFLDNDGDGAVDYPVDTGCHSATDLSEVPDCDDGLDNDFDGDTDFPDDLECRDAGDGSEKADCGDGLDNDGDGRVDFSSVPAAGDPGCADAADQDEMNPDLVCDNGIDDDCDGLTDFGLGPGRDPGCSFVADVPTAPMPGTPFGNERGDPVADVCDNGLDDDGDMLTDFSSDPSCLALGFGDPECNSIEDNSEGVNCSDGLDNDGDGRTDFDPDPLVGDRDCTGPDDPSEVPDCDDGLDNDGDGDIDFLADADCLGSELNQSEVPDCRDGVDNDADQATDFPDDPGCFGPDDQTEIPDCDDGADNDGDGLIDAGGEDPGCTDLADGTETSLDLVCDNGLDDDGDGFSDARLDPEVDDPGCADLEDDSELASIECDNGIDDDADGGIDVGGAGLGGPGDAQCRSPRDISERIACMDGLDNDGDGRTDFDPDPQLGDPGCESAADDDEQADCGSGDNDFDNDAVCDLDDNCLLVFNPAPQSDTNDNGIGNACDPDYDANGIVGGADYTLLRASLSARVGDPNYDPDVDSDCNGAIGSFDFIALRSNFGLPPGPSGCELLGTGCPPRTPDQLVCPPP